MSQIENRTGDVRVTSDSDLAVQTLDPSLVTNDPPQAEGDEHVADKVILVDLPESAKPATAKELRELGYTLPATTDADGKPVALADDDIPTAYVADTVLSADDPLAVQTVQLPENIYQDDLTPNERANQSTPADSTDESTKTTKSVKNSPEDK